MSHDLNKIKEIFAKLHRNDIFELEPSEVHFSGFSLDNNESLKKHVKIINSSDQVQRLTILPPLTKYFEIHYTKPDRLVPGFSVDVQITFKPDEYRYYNDSLRIHTKVSKDKMQKNIYSWFLFNFILKYIFIKLT